MKPKNQIIGLFAMAAIILASCARPAETAAPAMDMEKLKTEIQAMEDAFANAEKAKDADGVAAYYAEDAVSYNRNSEPISGKAAIRNKIAERMAADSSGSSNVYKVVDLFAEGNTAVEIGSWTVIDTAGKESEKGFYMSYFQKRDGKYLCVRDMNVTTTPNKEGM
jgi:uncharacterized protein (TIGR02246 family)